MTALPTNPSTCPTPQPACRGFSLVELAVVLVIVGLLASGLMLSLSTQRESATTQEAQRQLENIREALIGFALANGRLPCPAAANLANTDANAGRENCTSQHGVIPWVTLGLPESDPWGNRFTYYAHSLFTAPVPAGALAAFTLDTAGNAAIKDAVGAGYDIASALPAVIVCHGARPSGAWLPSGTQIAGASGDEAENANANTTFVAHTPTPSFDDQLSWIVPAILKSRMVAAGKLP